MVDGLKEPQRVALPTLPALPALPAQPLSLLTMNVIHGSILVKYKKLKDEKLKNLYA